MSWGEGGRERGGKEERESREGGNTEGSNSLIWCEACLATSSGRQLYYRSATKPLYVFLPQLGRRMAEFPVDPMMSKMLIASEK